MRKRINEIKNRLHLFGERGKWQHHLIKVLLSDLFCILVICLFVRLFLYSCIINTSNFTDTFSYLNYTGNIFNGNIDAHRTPIYPYFIKFIRLFGEDDLIRNIVFTQSAVSFISIFLFYKIVKYLINQKIIVFISCIFFGIFPSIVSLDKCILPESISVSAIVFFIYLITNYIIRPTKFKAIVSSFSVFFLIMLRPGFLYLIPIFFIFWFIRFITQKKERKICFLGISSLSFVLLLLYGYSYLNYKKNNAFTISIVSSINIVYEIINLKIYENSSDLPISNHIKLQMSGTENEAKNILGSYQGNDKEEVLSKIKFNIEDNKIWKLAAHDLIPTFSYNRVNDFISGSIKKNYKIFIKDKFLKFINLSKHSATPLVPQTKLSLKTTFLYVYCKLFDIAFIFIYIMIALDFLIIIIQWTKTKKIPWIKGVIWSVIAAQLCTIILGAPNGFDRLFLPALPLVILLLFCFLDRLLLKSFYKS